jgi:hypothetical protein
LILASLLVVVVAAVVVHSRGLPRPAAPRREVAESREPKEPGRAAGSGLGQPGPGKSAWRPPEGDPVTRYRELAGASPQARRDLLANFLALGHERNPYLLIAALEDADPSVRVFAVESASALEIGEAAAVLRAAAGNATPEVREMAWSLAAPYPADAKATIYAGAIEQGNAAALEEAFGEMSVTPSLSLFEMMLAQASGNPALSAERRTRLLRELQGWLEPGGGEVPVFADPAELLAWWRVQRGNYDEFLLRTDLAEP